MTIFLIDGNLAGDYLQSLLPNEIRFCLEFYLRKLYFDFLEAENCNMQLQGHALV
jgi:hypothetical protein